MASVPACALRRAGVSGRKLFRLSRLFAQFPSDTRAPAARLSADAGRKQRSSEGAQTIWTQLVPDRSVQRSVRLDIPPERGTRQAEIVGRLAAVIAEHDRLLRRLHLRNL